MISRNPTTLLSALLILLVANRFCTALGTQFGKRWLLATAWLAAVAFARLSDL